MIARAKSANGRRIEVDHVATPNGADRDVPVLRPRKRRLRIGTGPRITAALVTLPLALAAAMLVVCLLLGAIDVLVKGW